MIPDWSGWPAYVVAAGQSAAEVVPFIPRGGCKVVAVNLSFRLVPWADVLYAADTGFWIHYRDARAFPGLKICSENVRGVPTIQPVKLARDRTGLREMQMLQGPLGTIGSGGNSGFQALNYAVQTGANPICLVGFDYCGKHWHKDHSVYLRNPQDWNLRQWARTLDGQAETLASWGVDVLNLSPRSALRRFPNAHGRLPYPSASTLSPGGIPGGAGTPWLHGHGPHAAGQADPAG
jgi:hypothetical protein